MKINLPKINIPGPAKLVIKLLILAAIIFLIVGKIDEKLLLSVISKAKPQWVVLAIILFAISKLVSAFRFNEFLKTENIRLPAWDNVRLYWLCMYYNLLLPGGISGDAYKIRVLMERFGNSFKRLLTLTLMDRISGLIALIQIGFCLFAVLKFSGYWYVALILLVISFVASWYLFRRIIGRKVQVWILTTLFSWAVQGAQCLSVLALCFAFGLFLHAPDYILLFLVSSVVAMIPITIGGAGAREITFLFGAQYLQIQEEKAVAFAFLIYLISTGISLCGIVFSFSKKKADHSGMNGQQY